MKLYNGDKRKAIQETIRVCIQEGMHKKEVDSDMFELFGDEDMANYKVNLERRDALKDLVSVLKGVPYSFEEAYEKVRSIDRYSEFSKERIKKYYDEA